MKSIQRKSGRNSRRYLVMLICLILMVVLAVGGTLAYIFTSTEAVTNTFVPPQPDTTVDEKFDGLVKENVKIQVNNDNEAGVKSYVRAEVVVTWQEQTAGDDNVFSIIPAEKEDYTITYNLNSGKITGEWFLGTDGFYYYTEPVDPGDFTDILVTKCEQVRSAPAGYYLHVEILGQGIQAEPTLAATQSWGVTISGKTITGPKATTQSE